MMSIKADCYASYRGARELPSVRYGEKALEVLKIVDRSMVPTERCFRHRADYGSLFVLRHDEKSGEWGRHPFTHTKRAS